jgi:hypothetical protein
MIRDSPPPARSPLRITVHALEREARHAHAHAIATALHHSPRTASRHFSEPFAATALLRHASRRFEAAASTRGQLRAIGAYARSMRAGYYAIAHLTR